MRPPNLIVNADDFGVHSRVSLAIRQCLEEGLIDSFSVLPFQDAFHSDLLQDILARFPGVKVGAHLSLLEAGPEGVLDDLGHHTNVLGRYILGRLRPEEVRRRWEAQVEALGRYVGGADRLSHLDGHQHLHMLPGLWGAARAVQAKYRIPRLRIPYESLGRALVRRFPKGLALQILARLRWDGSSPRLIGFFTSTCFTVAANAAALAEAARRPERRFELMVHPALPPDRTRPAAAEGWPIAEGQVREMEELRRLPGFFRALAATRRSEVPAPG